MQRNTLSYFTSQILKAAIFIAKYNVFIWQRSLESKRFRLNILIAFFAIAYILLAVRIFSVSTGNYFNRNLLAAGKISFRHNIVDRYGNLLATNLPTSSLYATPKQVIDPSAAIEKLKNIWPNINSKLIGKKLASNKNFVWIKRDLSPKEQQEIYNQGMPGFSFEKEQKRIYPYGSLFAHAVGYVARDLKGLAGIESYFNNQLIGLEGEAPSANLQLSLDARMQSIMHEELNKTIEKFRADGGAGMIINPNNGEILAFVSLPDFNPHYPGDYLEASNYKLFNMLSQGVYELGSIMKAITMSIGLDTKATSLNDAYDLSYMKVKNFQVKDAHPLKGWHSVGEIFMKSSNIGLGQIMFEIGKERLRQYFKRLGLMNNLSLELNEKTSPLFQPYEKWDDLSMLTMSYGYGISESPAHFIQAMIPIVNGGKMVPLTLIKDKNKNHQAEQVLSSKTSLDMRKLLRLTIAEGTGRKAEVEGFYFGGKTGTANKAIDGKYDKSQRYSSFVGILPAHAPKYMIYVLFDNPKGTKESFGFAGGGWTSAPTAGNIAKRIIAIEGIKPPNPNSKEIKELIDIPYKIKRDI